MRQETREDLGYRVVLGMSLCWGGLDGSQGWRMVRDMARDAGGAVY